MKRSDRLSLVDATCTFLLVPGDRPERFDKAIAARADIVVIDLEDAVAPGTKDEARAAVARWLPTGPPVRLRVNACGTPDMEVVRDDAERARSDGFRQARHSPSVGRCISRRLSATRLADGRATQLIEADRGRGGSSVSLNGQTIDTPLVERARQLVASTVRVAR